MSLAVAKQLAQTPQTLSLGLPCMTNKRDYQTTAWVQKLYKIVLSETNESPCFENKVVALLWWFVTRG
jgi:hypothetical protein